MGGQIVLDAALAVLLILIIVVASLLVLQEFGSRIAAQEQSERNMRTALVVSDYLVKYALARKEGNKIYGNEIALEKINQEEIERLRNELGILGLGVWIDEKEAVVGANADFCLGRVVLSGRRVVVMRICIGEES